MNITVRPCRPEDLPGLIEIWNQVVEEGTSFPQEELLTAESGAAHFAAQTHVGAAVDADAGTVVGLYILHPNNVGRCGHIGNAGYMVRQGCRGLHIGEKLVADSIAKARDYGFAGLQFNAVVGSNTHARHLYTRMGFAQAGSIPRGFRMKDGRFEDIFLYYRNV